MEEQTHEIKIIRFDKTLSHRDNIIKEIFSFLVELDCDYPNFRVWLSKVFRQIGTGKRILLVVYDEIDNIAGIAILKKCNYEKKICTLRVRTDMKNKGIGSLLIRKSIEELNENKPLITVSEHHIQEFRSLFKKFKFTRSETIKSLYKDGVKEFIYNKPFRREYALMSIKPQYSHKILSGEKVVEFRKKCFTNDVKYVYIYSSSPERRIIGLIHVENVIEGSINSIWENFKYSGGISKEAYFDYFKNHKRGYVIKIRSVEIFKRPIDPKILYGKSFHVPQNYMYVNKICLDKEEL